MSAKRPRPLPREVSLTPLPGGGQCSLLELGGWRVLLAEKGDLAGATSSASTKLIHGGLRYLEHYKFRLVREALMERGASLEQVVCSLAQKSSDSSPTGPAILPLPPRRRRAAPYYYSSY